MHVPVNRGLIPMASSTKVNVIERKTNLQYLHKIISRLVAKHAVCWTTLEYVCGSILHLHVLSH